MRKFLITSLFLIGLGLFSVPHADAALRVVQSTARQDSFNVSSGQASFSTLPSAGNLIVVNIPFFNGNGTTVTSVADNQGNTYIRAAQRSELDLRAEVWYAQNIGTPSGTFTITVTWGDTVFAPWSATEVFGAAVSNSLDVGSTASTSDDADPVTITSGASTRANEIVFAVTTIGFAVSDAQLVAPTPGYTEIHVYQDGNTAIPVEAAYKIVSTTGTHSATWSHAAGSPYAFVALIAAFKAAPPKTLIKPPAFGTVKISASPTGVIINGLVGHWTFDGPNTNWGSNTTSDSSSGGSPGTLTNMSTTTSPVAGKIGQALKFDGVDDFVSMGDILDFETNQPFSISAWVKLASPDVVGAENATIVSKIGAEGGVPGYWAYIRPTNSDFFFQLRGSAGVMTAAWSGAMTTNWEHVVFVYDGSQSSSGLTLYRNGALQTQSSSFDQPLAGSSLTAGSLQIGDTDNLTHRFQAGGAIDEVRIYNRVLSLAEAKRLYSSGLGAKIIIP